MLQYNYVASSELYHHGIKGQRWGVRRFQNKDGSLTSKGKKRYEDSENSKSNHRLKLEEKYRNSGMSQKQAEMAAERRIQTEKIIAITAGITLTAAAAYATNKYVQNNVDRIIKSGKTLQRIEMQDTGGKIHDVFYAAKNNGDKTKYAGMLGKARQQQTGHAYVMQLAAKKDVKVASKKNAEKVFKDLYDRDSSFRETIDKIAGTNVHGGNAVKGLKNPFEGTGRFGNKDISKVYDNFNSRLVEMHGNEASKKFYDALKAKGYGAIQDVNDMKFSGYNAKNPLIVFGAKDNVMVKSMREMTNDEINKALIKDGAKQTAKLTAKMLAVQASPYAGIAALGVVGTRTTNTKAINDYRRKHPNTDKTDKEIIEMLNKQEG